MNSGEKGNIKRARWSEFDGLVNPNSRVAEIMLSILLPVAVFACLSAVSFIAYGTLDPKVLFVIVVLFLFLVPSASSRREDPR